MACYWLCIVVNIVMAILIIPNNLIRKTHANELCSLDELLRIDAEKDQAIVVVPSDRGYLIVTSNHTSGKLNGRLRCKLMGYEKWVPFLIDRDT